LHERRGARRKVESLAKSKSTGRTTTGRFDSCGWKGAARQFCHTTRRSFGSRLIEDVLPYNVDGKVIVFFDPAGFSLQLDAPTNRLRSLD
jgi:hypothetical protein